VLWLVTIDLADADLGAFERYEAAVLGLVPSHGGRVELRVQALDRRTETHLLYFPGEDAFERFRSDPARLALSAEWKRCGARSAVQPVDNDRVKKIRATRRKLAADGPASVRSAGDFERVSIPNSDGDALRDLLIAERANTAIEIGLAYGSSALAIAEALVIVGSDHARHVIIDAYQDGFHRSGWSAIAEAGLVGLCSLIEERSQTVLPRLLGKGFLADAAFVDGSHIFHNVFVDLFYLRELVRPDGLVILDDYSYPSVATAVRYFEANTGWQTQLMSTTTRLRGFRLPKDRTEPSFESFKPFGLDTAR
jgi:predicted O-methyltransferase YrrM